MDRYLPEHRHITIHQAEVLQNPGSVHDLIRERMSYMYINLNGVLGWQLIDSEYEDAIADFLLFIEFVIDENNSVPMIYRAHDLYTIGHLDGNRHAFLLNQDREGQLYRTMECLNHYGIPYTLMEELGDSYPDLEAAAEIRRADLAIGQDGFETALNFLLMEDPLEVIRNTSFSYLYLSIFVCEGRRILHVRDSIINHFAGMGVPVPEILLQYLYGWGAASYILWNYAIGNQGPFNYYSIIADFGRMGIQQMAGTFDFIKQAVEPRNINTDMVDLYHATVNQFNQRMFGEHP
ncbi:hypothetical protein ACET3Z_020895 [Daucus carota]